MFEKEKNNRVVQFVVKPSIFTQFKKVCEKNERTISSTLKELMLDKIREEENKPK